MVSSVLASSDFQSQGPAQQSEPAVTFNKVAGLLDKRADFPLSTQWELGKVGGRRRGTVRQNRDFSLLDTLLSIFEPCKINFFKIK